MSKAPVDALRLEQVSDLLRAAAAAAAAALPLPEAPLVGAPVTSGRPILFGPPARTLVATLSGPVSGEVALVLSAEIVELLEAESRPNLCEHLAPTLLSAAQAMAAQLGEVTLLAEPDSNSPDVAVPLTQSGMPVAALQLYRRREHHSTPAEPTVPIELIAPMTPPPATAAAASRQAATVDHHRLDQLTHVQMEVTVEIGRTRMPVGELLALTPGQVVDLDRPAGAPVDLLVNGTLLAHGEIVVVDEDFGFRVTEIARAREK